MKRSKLTFRPTKGDVIDVLERRVNMRPIRRNPVLITKVETGKFHGIDPDDDERCFYFADFTFLKIGRANGDKGWYEKYRSQGSAMKPN